MPVQNATVIIVTVICLLLIVSAFTQLVSKYTKIPFTILLIVVGFLLSYLTKNEHGILQNLIQYQGYPDILLFVCLPTLIFEAAFTMDGRLLRQNIIPILALSIPGLFLSTFLIGLIVYLLTPFTFPIGLLIGAILSATDSVAVVAIFKQLNVPKRLSILIEGESLFNSSTAFVVVKAALFIILTASFTTHVVIWDTVYQFIWNFFGGILVGLVVTYIIGYFISLMDDEPIIVVSLAIILVYLSFIVAESVVHVSGVMSTITAGVMMADWGRTKISALSEKQISLFLKFLIYIVNSLIFILVGFSINISLLLNSIYILAIVILAMLVARAAMVFGLLPIVSKLPHSNPINLRYQAITWLSGIQGAIGLTIVLGISQQIPEHNLLLSIVMGAVLFTILVQGSLIGKMIHWLKLDRPVISDKIATIEAELAAENMTLTQISLLQKGGSFSLSIAKKLEEACKKVISKKSEQLHHLKKRKLTDYNEKIILFLACFSEEKNMYYEMFSKGHLSEQSFRVLNHNIDMEIDTMRFSGKIIRKMPESIFQKIISTGIRLIEKIPLPINLYSKLKIHQSITDYEEKWGSHQGCIAVLQHLDAVTKSETVKKSIIDDVKHTFLHWFVQTNEYLNRVADQFPEFVHDMQTRFAKRVLLFAKSEAMINQVQQGLVAQSIADKITKKYIHSIQLLRKENPETLKLDTLDLLRQLRFFKNLSENDLNEVMKVLKKYHALPGEILINEGEIGDTLYFIARGVVRVIKKIDDRETDVATLMAGDFFGEIALLQHVKRTATCKAITPCILYTLNREDFEKLVRRFPIIYAILHKER